MTVFEVHTREMVDRVYTVEAETDAEAIEKVKEADYHRVMDSDAHIEEFVSTVAQNDAAEDRAAEWIALGGDPFEDGRG